MWSAFVLAMNAQAPDPQIVGERWRDMWRQRLDANTCWSIELAATLAVPEWSGQEVTFRGEENAFFDGKAVHFIDGRETELRLISGK